MRVRFDADVLSLLPNSGITIPAFHRYVNAFGGIDDLYVIFTAPEGRSVADYDAVIDQWTTALRSAPEIAEVDTGVVDGSRNFGWLADHQLLLLSGEALERAINR